MMLECEKRRDCCGDRTTEDERESAGVLVVEEIHCMSICSIFDVK